MVFCKSCLDIGYNQYFNVNSAKRRKISRIRKYHVFYEKILEVRKNQKVGCNLMNAEMGTLNDCCKYCHGYDDKVVQPNKRSRLQSSPNNSLSDSIVNLDKILE